MFFLLNFFFLYTKGGCKERFSFKSANNLNLPSFMNYDSTTILDYLSEPSIASVSIFSYLEATNYLQ